MNIDFLDPSLQELYETGKTKDKKYAKLQQSVINQFIKKINIIKPLERIENLYQIKSLHYEKKGGYLKGQEAVYINDQYRLFFTSSEDKDTLKVSNIVFEKISKHYED